MKSWKILLILVATATTLGLLLIRPGTSRVETLLEDGSRSDVKSFVQQTYPNAEVVSAAMELHKAIQQAIADPEHWDSARATRAQGCLHYLAPEQAAKIVREIEAQTANTKERLRAYWRANAKLSGTILPHWGTKEESCAFDKKLLKAQ